MLNIVVLIARLSLRSAPPVLCAFEGSFNGVAALTNSLVQAGFQASAVVGYRGSIPTWLAQLKKDHVSGSYVVAPQVHLKLVSSFREHGI
jgi:hypothetical protein